ncbi:hypothetical protein E0H26_05240 [Micromonospora zingiberis]|uniref:Uncharacterized protein n=1 Tax=Micromonospora zingiberis TaxID=2053011 RepID=A0A4R0GQT4_9ACTN|nr:hypothetical protein [Micromonospora zingiberis]TCB99940.1 hypothetical protein E0H26_05240 [Micromonospora zingiberis]
MSVRRRATRLATVCVFLGGLVLVGAAPAHADEDRVRVRSAGSFTAGRSAEGVRLEVRKRTEGCVRVRGALGLSLPGVRPEQVAVQAEVGGQWVSVPVSGGDGLVTTAPVAPEKDELCKGKGATIRYRVAFGADAPGGRLFVTGEAVTARGALLGRAVAESRVAGGRVAPSPSPSRSPSPSPTPDEESAPSPSVVATPTVALAADTPAVQTQSADQSSGGSPVMYFGVAMVAAGALLIGLLVHRSRKDRRRRREQAEVPLPGNPGGTTYRSSRAPGVAPTPAGPGTVPPAVPGQVYGSGRPGTPRVYGGTPAPRPSGGLYGARPAGASDQTRAMPSEAPDGSAVVPPTSAPPAQPGPGVVPQRQDPSASAGEGADPGYGRGLPG